MSSALHSFVVPVHGVSIYLEESVQSLLHQTRQGKVYLATSTPSEELQSTSSRLGVPLIVNPSRQGIAADWSFALNLADTQYVTLAHQDDLYDSGYVEACVKTAERYPENVITFTHYREVRGERITGLNVNLAMKRVLLTLAYGMRLVARTPRQKWRLLAFGSPIPCPSVMYNRRAIGSFAFSDNYQVNLDWDAWIRLIQRPGSFVLVRQTLMTHRIHASSQTSEGIRNRRRQQEDLDCFQRLWPGTIARLLASLYTLSYRSNQ